MSLYSTIKADVESVIYDNLTQDIKGENHQELLKRVIDAVGAIQIYGPTAITFNPGTPQNPRCYIQYPGIYSNFGGMVVTAPLGLLLWDGSAWSVIQLAIPSPYDYFQAKTTAALTLASSYTSVAITQSNGGWTASAGQWVQIVNRRTGKCEQVQLTANLTPSATSITFATWTMHSDFPIGSIIECFPMVNMKWWAEIPVVGAPVDYVDLPSDWRLPPNGTSDTRVWQELLFVSKNSFECEFNATPTEEFQYKRHATLNRLHFSAVLEVGDRIRVRCFQPRLLTFEPF